MTPEQNLWCEVLRLAITDALEGVPGVHGNVDTEARIKNTDNARKYLTQAKADMIQVCTMAGLEPDAVQEHATRLIAKAPTPAELTRSGRRNDKARTFTCNGQTLALSQWSDLTGIPSSNIAGRIRRGWSIERAITTTGRGDPVHDKPKPKRQRKWKTETKPKRPRRPFVILTHEGRTMKLAEWSAVTGVAVATLRMRLNKGWTVEATLSTPLTRRSSLDVQLARRGMAKADDAPATDHDADHAAQTPGVPSHLAPSLGTGGGTSAQETTNINFPQDCAA